MLLQALVEYYGLLCGLEDYDISQIGYSTAKVSYVLLIGIDGRLKGLRMIKHLDNKGKKLIPREMQVPEQPKRANGIVPYFLCDNSSYVLGIDNKREINKSKEYFEGFRKYNLDCLETINTEEVNAVKKYLRLWKVEEAKDNPLLQEYKEDICAGANLIFQVEGYQHYVHQAPEVIKAWEKMKADSKDKIIRTCLVTGKQEPIAIIHPSIKGIRGGQAMGNTLISFNASAYESYGNIKSQGLNAPIGEYSAFAYGMALNYLLADARHRLTLGDATIVFWAQSPKSKEYQDIFSLMNNPDNFAKEEELEEYTVDIGMVRIIKRIFEKIAQGEGIDNSVQIDKKVQFYILAISPNAARISIRFFIKNEFGILLERLIEHYRNLAIEKQFENEPDAISVWRMLNETVAQTSKEKKASPQLTGALLRAIWQGERYPTALFQAIMIRLRADKEVSYIKAAVIKAYLLRCSSNQKYKNEGVLKMSLNKESENKAYVLGRLFAVLEWAQMNANPGINATIKDRYFTSACATPAVTFPVLLRLSNHHVAKAEYGRFDEMRIDEIMQLLHVDQEPFPKRLTLEEQGIFILGYYHQKNQLYKEIKEKSKTKKNNVSNQDVKVNKEN